MKEHMFYLEKNNDKNNEKNQVKKKESQNKPAKSQVWISTIYN